MMLSEVILERDGFECGYHRATTTNDEPMAAIWNGEKVTTFNSIVEARAAFWNIVINK